MFILWMVRHGVILNLGSGRSPFLKDLLRRTSGELRRTVIQLSIKDSGKHATIVHSISKIAEDYKNRSSVLGYNNIDRLFDVTDYYIPSG